MIFLVSTTQRCGSTWLVRMLEAMTGSAGCYVNGLEMGFRLRPVSAGTAVVDLGKMLRAARSGRVFKTHDVPSRDFDAVCAELPEVRVLTVSRDFRDVLVSRYFYYRYYWPADATLGALPRHLAEFFGTLGKAGDRGGARAAGGKRRFAQLGAGMGGIRVRVRDAKRTARDLRRVAGWIGAGGAGVVHRVPASATGIFRGDAAGRDARDGPRHAQPFSSRGPVRAVEALVHGGGSGGDLGQSE